MHEEYTGLIIWLYNKISSSLANLSAHLNSKDKKLLNIDILIPSLRLNGKLLTDSPVEEEEKGRQRSESMIAKVLEEDDPMEEFEGGEEEQGLMDEVVWEWIENIID